jgi:class 3 adenylate cyclase
MLESGSRKTGPSSLSPFDRAALETLGAMVVVPVRYRESLLAFMCLGRKRSGDIYTPTELTLLSAVAGKIAAELMAERTGPASAASGDATVVQSAAAGERFIGRYRIQEQVGSGAAGIVYRAYDPTIGRTVALKVIPVEPEGATGDPAAGSSAGERRFRREAAAAGSLVHGNIVTLYDAGRDGDSYYLAMEYLAGKTFADEMRQEGRIAVARAIEVGAGVADALDYAHEQGVVHRDIKPANLLLLEDGTVKVADFGIARLTESSTVTAEGTFVGTPNYVSPEQLKRADIDGRSDLFSLGVLLYEALTGEHPFRRSNLAATINAILSSDPASPEDRFPDVPAALSVAVMRALEKNPDHRFQCGKDLAEALEAAAGPAAGAAGGSMRRRLAAILSADVVGYSRMMSRNEASTLEALKAHRELIRGLVATHNGRVFGGAGDSVIAEFASPVAAVTCALEIQVRVEAHNTTLPPDQRMEFRIGVNLGDVIVDRGNLFGDGVNVAARLEALAEPGGTCISGSVHEHVRRKIDASYEDIGPQALKNIEEPVRVYRVRP